MNGFGIHGVTAKSDTNEHKIAYYQEINSTTGTVTVPTGGTILLNQLAGGADALVSTIDGVPTGSLPQTAGGVQVDVTSFDSSGNYVLSGTPSSYPVALIYWLKISGADYSNLTTANIIEENIPLLVDNIYTADGTLTGDRTITGGGNDISFSGGSGGSKVLLWNGDDLDISGTDGQFTTGQVHIHGTRGMSSPSHGKGQFYFASTYDNAPYINRNIADANPALIIDQEHAGSTGDIAQFWNSTGTVASITNDGYITAQAATGTSDTVAIWDGTTLKKKELKNQTIFASNPYDNVLAGVSENMAIHGSGNFSPSNRRFTIMPKDGILSDFWVSTQGFQDASGDLVLVLQVNFVDTPLSLTITNADGVSITKSETATSVSVSAGDKVRIKITNNATATSTNVVSSTLLYTFD